MRAAMTAILTIAIVLASSCAGTYAPSDEFSARLCPRDRHYCGEGCSPDLFGNCRPCGRRPVDVTALTLTWHWCGVHHAWHDKPCKEDATHDCCEAFESTALGSAGGAATASRPYCPACRLACDEEFPLDDAGRCAACGRTPVNAETVRRTWHWCADHRAWHDVACSPPC